MDIISRVTTVFTYRAVYRPRCAECCWLKHLPLFTPARKTIRTNSITACLCPPRANCAVILQSAALNNGTVSDTIKGNQRSLQGDLRRDALIVDSSVMQIGGWPAGSAAPASTPSAKDWLNKATDEAIVAVGTWRECLTGPVNDWLPLWRTTGPWLPQLCYIAYHEPLKLGVLGVCSWSKGH